MSDFSSSLVSADAETLLGACAGFAFTIDPFGRGATMPALNCDNPDMDVLGLLDVVSEAYRSLQTLEAEAIATDESSDEGRLNHSEQRVRFAYAAPNLVRMEHPKRTGGITVSDGRDLHHYFGLGGGRYSKIPVPQRERLPGMFPPEYAAWGGAQGFFVFERINERVSGAETLPPETLVIGDRTMDCERVSVTYEAPPHAGFLVAASPIIFWVDKQTRLIVRKENEVTMKTPDGDLRTTKHMFTLSRFVADQSIAPETFTLERPKDALDVSPLPGQQRCLVGFGGGGSLSNGEGKRQISHQGSHNWDGDTLVEQSKWTFRGHEITFQRRFTLSDDEKRVLITERIIGPKEETERSLSIPVA
jgi:outer membrane lipoprotein-sorting protein